MKQFIQKIKNFYIRSLQGKENFWITFLVWGLGLYVVGNVIIYSSIPFSLYMDPYLAPYLINSESFAGYAINIPFGMLGGFIAIFTLTYPFILAFVLIKSSLKQEKHKKLYFLISIIFLLLFILHYKTVFLFNLFISLMMSGFSVVGIIKGMLIGSLLMLPIFIVLVINTIKAMKQNNVK